MPNWKKVIVSGSDAALNSLFVRTSVTASTVLVNTTSSADVIAGTDYLKIVASGSGGGANTTFGFSNNDNTGQGFMSITNGTVTGYGVHVNNTDGLVYGTLTNYPITLRTNNTNRLTIDGSGNTKLLFVPNTQQSNVLTYNTSTGLICYTASSALGGGGAGFPYTGDAVISGSLTITGSGLVITGSIGVTNGFTGSLFGTSSWATRAITASFLTSGTYNITSSWAITAVTSSYATLIGFGSGIDSPVILTNALATSQHKQLGTATGFTFNTTTGILNVTSSQALTASYSVSASYAATASYYPNIRAGSVPTSSFGAIGATAVSSSFISFSTPFPDTNYSITVTLSRLAANAPNTTTFSTYNKQTTGFRIYVSIGIAALSATGWNNQVFDYIAVSHQ